METQLELNANTHQSVPADQIWAHLRSDPLAKNVIQQYAVEAIRDEIALINSAVSQQIEDIAALISNTKQRIRQYALEAVKEELIGINQSVELLAEELTIATQKGLDEIRSDLNKKYAAQDHEQSTADTASHERKIDFHTAYEIRELIVANIDAIQSYFHGRPVSCRALIDHIQTYTELRPGDMFMRDGNIPRWNKQVNNAIRKQNWPESPFIQVKRGYYRIEYWKSAP